jgi:preprotein translocase subunit SecA
MDKQRRSIYSIRSNILEGADISDEVNGIIEDYIDMLLEEYIPENQHPETWNLNGLTSELLTSLGIHFDLTIEDGFQYGRDGLRRHLEDQLKEQYSRRKESLGAEEFSEMERMIFLQIIDNRWKDHLYEIDHLKEGISYRSYGGKDPIIEYKREAFMSFTQLMDSIKKEVVTYLFRASHQILSRQVTGYGRGRAVKDDAVLPDPSVERQLVSSSGSEAAPTAAKQRITGKKTGRNEPCPCGSGRKYKHCCGQ